MIAAAPAAAAAAPPPAIAGVPEMAWLGLNAAEARRALQLHGVLLVRGALPAAEVAAAKDELLAFVRALAGPGHETASWAEVPLPPSQGGLVQHFGAGMNPASVRVREALAPLFEALCGTADLWTSMDGFSAGRKPRVRARYADLADWRARALEATPLHTDQTQNPFSGAWQSGAALTDQAEDEHCFVCVPGSHRLVEPLVRARAEAPKDKHWMLLDAGQLDFLRTHGMQPARVPMRAGDVVLWDSRTVHSSAKPCASARADMLRLQVFVCMQPAPPRGSALRAREQAKRRRYAQAGRTSKHSPLPIRVFGEHWAGYSNEDRAHGRAIAALAPPVDLAAMSARAKRLHGLED